MRTSILQSSILPSQRNLSCHARPNREASRARHAERLGYHLTRGGVLLAELTPVDDWRLAEFPCVNAQYTTTDAFTAVKPLFDATAFSFGNGEFASVKTVEALYVRVQNARSR